MTTAYVTHPRYAEHRLPGYQHPECPDRVHSIWELFAQSGVIDRLLPLEPRFATRQELEAVHTPTLLDTLALLATQNKAGMLTPDTYAMPTSFEIARLSAGGALRAVEAVVRGEADNALAVVRPPGHHATADRVMGFCLLSNVAIAAQYALDVLGLQRVLVVDYDVHHGNGTQEIFYSDDRVLFVSTHQYPFYPPNSGALEEIGEGKGEGYNVNIPLVAGHGDASYKAVFEEIIAKVAHRYQPQLVVVSAGFDAHWGDPLAMMRLTLTGYAWMTRRLVELARAFCDGRIVFVLEGGYDLTVVSHGMLNVAYALLGEDIISDPLGGLGSENLPVAPLIARIAALHGL